MPLEKFRTEWVSPEGIAGTIENRCAPRIRVSIPAQLRTTNGRPFNTTVRDISTAGFCAASVYRLAPSTRLWLTLPGLAAQPAQVVWWNASLAGCAFTDMISPIVLDSLIERWRHSQRLYPSC